MNSSLTSTKPPNEIAHPRRPLVRCSTLKNHYAAAVGVQRLVSRRPPGNRFTPFVVGAAEAVLALRAFSTYRKLDHCRGKRTLELSRIRVKSQRRSPHSAPTPCTSYPRGRCADSVPQAPRSHSRKASH